MQSHKTMNKSLFAVGLIALLVGGFIGYVLHPSTPESGGLSLGAITVPTISTTTHATALHDSLLFQWESNVANWINNSFAGIKFGEFALSDDVTDDIINATTSAHATGSLSGIAQGDNCFATLTNTSTKHVQLNAYASTTDLVGIDLTGNDDSDALTASGIGTSTVSVICFNTGGFPATSTVSTTSVPSGL